MSDFSEKLLPLFNFRPWPQGDPVAPWVFEQLDKNQLINLARIGLEFNQAVLQAQLKANSQALEVFHAAKK